VTKRVVLLDYGSGNLRSAQRALDRVGADVVVTADYDAALGADGLVVPGVGAFGACMKGLHEVRGHQVLFERGVEHGVETVGCGEWPGTVELLQARVVPHTGWNTVDVPDGSRLFAGAEQERFYFVHSYAVRRWELPAGGPLRPPLVSWTTHESDTFVAAVENGPLWATQFHPEKSGDAGAVVLRQWVQQL
jgi:glutamine amidotransferase